MAKAWSVYLLRCGDGSLYCGVARDVNARLAQHAAGKGAKYTRGRGPLTLLAARRCKDQGSALRLERAVKGLTRKEKLVLASSPGELAKVARRARDTHTRSLRPPRPIPSPQNAIPSPKKR